MAPSLVAPRGEGSYPPLNIYGGRVEASFCPQG